jgi:hypothetical protein
MRATVTVGLKRRVVDVLQSRTPEIGFVLRVQDSLEAALAVDASYPAGGQTGFENPFPQQDSN